MRHPRPQHHRYRNRYAILLAFFLAQLLSAPIFEDSILAGYVGDFFFYLILVTATFSVRNSRFFKLAVLFGIGTVVGETLSYFTDRLSVLIVTNFVASAFLAVVTLQIGVNVAQQREIRSDTVMGGLCVYVLMGIFWCMLFINLELLNSGSFSFGKHGDHMDLDAIYGLLFYYSYVTLLTIGYGDVVPMSHMAQTLTILEGLIGQFYLIFFMASLVGLYIYRRSYDPMDRRDDDVKP